MIAFSAGADAQVTITLQQPPPYQFKLEHMWKVTLMNPTRTTFNVYTVGRATERRDGRIVEATTAISPFPPGLYAYNMRARQFKRTRYNVIMI
ncbi:MAG: hypothetical protein IPP94_14915 [Ignavibacteria bacterium]|nr:hypothetical protein [Ignavibacteria bacterium]